MTVINHKSISGVTSITAPAGSDDLLTVHTNDTSERFRILKSGAIVTGVATASNFKTGTSNLHNVGVEVAGINVLGADTPIGTGATIYDAGGAVFTGVVTATSFKGSITDATGYTTINNNANNRLVTGSGTANTLDAEAALTFYNSGSDPILTLSNSGHAQLTLTSTSGSDHCGVNFGDSDDNNAGMIQYTNNGDYMVFHTAGGKRVQITSGGQVNIGGNYTQTTDTLQVDGNIRGGNVKATAAFYADGNANTSLQLHSTGTTGQSRIFFGDASTFQAGKIVYDHTNDYMYFGGGGAGAEKLRIDSSGHMSLGGGATPSSTNGGIGLKFGIKSAANNILIGETTSSSHNGLILESRLTGRTGGARASQINIGQDGTGGRIVFSTAPASADVTERLRINAAGQLIVGSGTNTIINAFKLAVKETAGENAAIVFLDTDNMKGGICGIAKGTDQLITGTTNVDFIVGSSYNKTHIITGNGSNSTGYIRATATTSGNFIVGHTADRDVGSTAFGRLQVHTSNSIVNTALASYGNNAGGCILALGHSRHATIGSVGVALQNNDHLGDIRFAGDDGTDLETTACNIIGAVDGSVSGNTIPGRLEFWTSGTRRLSISSGGHVRANQNGLKYSTDSSGWHQQIQGGATNPGGTIIFTGGNSTGDLKFYAQGATSTLSQRMRIHSDGMLEYRNHGNSKTHCFSSGQSGAYSTCTIVIDAHAYHSFVIDVAHGGYGGVWGTARYMGYENGSMYNANEGTETTDSNTRNITHDQNPGGGHKHRIRITGGMGTHPVVQLQITIGGPDAYIDTSDISYTWA